MIVCKNISPYPVERMLGIAPRENNRKRGYVLVNSCQGKHVPVAPGIPLNLFQCLAGQMAEAWQGKTVTFIGFAETATAIGAHVAACFPGNSRYMQTTRERLGESRLVVSFQEEHSHATNQALYCEDEKAMLQDVDAIFFVEDEVTTGKTILNFIQALENQGIYGPFGVLTLVNNMPREGRQRFQSKNICLYSLVELEDPFPGTIMTGHYGKQYEEEWLEATETAVVQIGGRVEPRLGLLAAGYVEACEALAGQVAALWQGMDRSANNILVLGTEECMYPALCCGKALQEGYGLAVKVHATTRSPIIPGGEGSPLENRSMCGSFYEKNRQTYLYNLAPYDHVFVVTDALNPEEEGITQLAGVLRGKGNKHITIVEWVK